MELGTWQLLANQGSATALQKLKLDRASHSCTVHGKYIYVIAGRKGSTFLGDVVRFDVERRAWEELKGITLPERANHVALLVGNKIWVIGGSNKDVVHGDVWVLDLDTHKWSNPKLR